MDTLKNPIEGVDATWVVQFRIRQVLLPMRLSAANIILHSQKAILAIFILAHQQCSLLLFLSDGFVLHRNQAYLIGETLSDRCY